MENKDPRKEFYDKHNADYTRRNFIERFFDKLFFALNRDIKVTFLVLSILYGGFITTKYINSLEQRMDEGDLFRDRMIEEIRRDINPLIDKKIDLETKELENKVDNANQNLYILQETLEDAFKELIKTK